MSRGRWGETKLTAMESAVAKEYIYRYASGPTIAKRLGLKTNQVNSALTRVILKLGFTSRPIFWKAVDKFKGKI